MEARERRVASPFLTQNGASNPADSTQWSASADSIGRTKAITRYYGDTSNVHHGKYLKLQGQHVILGGIFPLLRQLCDQKTQPLQ